MDLTPEQAVTLRDAVRDRSGYFHAVKIRMYQRGVGRDDPLYVLFDAVEQAMIRLATELHNRSIVLGGRRPWEPGGTTQRSG